MPQDPRERYMFRVADGDGEVTTMHDPYAFDSLLSDFDFYLFGQGRHERMYDKLGAHVRTVDGVTGTNFAVWAPNATSVSIVGGFNKWDVRRHPMRKHIPSGIWELFVPDVGPGEQYKFLIRSWDGQMMEKTDPYGFAAELPPRTASIVADLSRYHWNDHEWMDQRRSRDPLNQAISIYEVHLGSWRRSADHHHGWLNYRELARQLVDYCHQMGYTHLELMPVSEHPFTGSWGYQTVGYFAVTSRYGTPEDFMYFVDHCHRNGIGVILDWVPAHFPRDGHGLRRFDGTALYEHADPRQGEHPDWGTMIFNYGRNEVRNFLVSNALFWLDKYHIDGLRVDAVASMLYLDYSRPPGGWIPNKYGGRENIEAIEFLRRFNTEVFAKFPHATTAAEESTAWPQVSRPVEFGGLGFGYKWNMGWMHDTLDYISKDPIHRKYHHDQILFGLHYAFSENFILPLSHDEVVHGKRSILGRMPGDDWQRFANLRAYYAFMFAHPGKKLMFMGSEFGQEREWDHDHSLDWHLLDQDRHRGIQALVRDLNNLYRQLPALHELDCDPAGFEWIITNDADHNVFAWMRKGNAPRQRCLVVVNFSPNLYEDYRVRVPFPGRWREVFNSDSAHYGGSNKGNVGGRETLEGLVPHLSLTIPPLAAIYLVPDGE